MSVSYLPKDSLVQDLALKVQELSVRLGDNAIVSVSGSTATINVQENIDHVRSAIFVDDSAGTAAPVVASNRVVSGTSVTLTLSAALAAADCIALKYVVSD